MGYQKNEKIKNKNKIFKYISSQKEFNKQDITDNLSLSFPTVTKYIEEFLSLNIISELGMKNSKYNRPAMSYKFNSNSLYSIGIKLEINKISFILINLKGKIIQKEEINNNFYNNPNFIKYILHHLKLFIQNFKDKNKIIGIGISLPGVVNNISKVFEIGTNFKIFSQDMKIIEQEMELPVYLINEANAGVFGEYILHNYAYKNLSYISIETGIGVGIILDNQIYEGDNFKAGELGHISIIPKGRSCSCGNKGCFEKYCSNLALVEDFKESFPKEYIQSLQDIFFNNLHEDPIGKKILETYVENLARGIQTFMLLFDLNKIIIGGEICNYKNYFNFQELLNSYICTNVFCTNKNIIEFSSQGNDSNLIGAALITFKDFL
ncbi:MAG: ROK family protein [Cetobacterium sp.]|uniref:ROK family protein n=1 Tax=Cetobacterium sp. TaxID=2071632 RepID=UPI003F3459CC